MTLSELESLLPKPMRRTLGAWLMGLLMLATFAAMATWQPAGAGAPAAPYAPYALVAGDTGAGVALADGASMALSAPAGPARLLAGAVPGPRKALAAAVLAAAYGALGVFALLLAATQRSRVDGALGLSSLAWSAHTALSSGVAGVAVSVPLLQLLMLAAVASLVWCKVRLAGWRAHEAPRLALWPAWLLGIGCALVLGWSRGAGAGAARWMVPVAGLVAAAVTSTRLMSAGRLHGARQRRSLGAWWVALVGAAAIGCGAYEIWLRISAPQALEAHPAVWLLTRWCVVALMAGMLTWRLAQVARTSHQLGHSHRQWRRRLRSSEAELQDARRGLGLRDRAELLRAQRDQVAREALDEAIAQVHRHSRTTDTAAPLEEALGALQWVRDSLDLAPRPIDEAFELVCVRLARRLRAEGGHLRWTLDRPTRGVVLPAGETLQWQRLAAEAVSTALSLGWGGGRVAVRLEVLDGETGRHLRLMVGAADRADSPDSSAGSPPGGTPAAAARSSDGATPPVRREQDLFGAPNAPEVQQCRIRLQRLATALGAQVALEARLSESASLEVVMPLKAR